MFFLWGTVVSFKMPVLKLSRCSLFCWLMSESVTLKEVQRFIIISTRRNNVVIFNIDSYSYNSENYLFKIDFFLKFLLLLLLDLNLKRQVHIYEIFFFLFFFRLFISNKEEKSTPLAKKYIFLAWNRHFNKSWEVKVA